MLPDLLQYNLQPCPLLRLSVLHSRNNPYFKYTVLDDMKFLKQAYMNSHSKETVLLNYIHLNLYWANIILAH